MREERRPRAGSRPSIGHQYCTLRLDEAELHHRQRDDDDHQDHRLRRGAAEVGRLHAVVVDLVDQDLGRLPGPALGGRVDDAEGVEEGVDDVHHQQEEGGRRQQREDDGPEAPQRPGAVDGRRLDQRLRDRLQAGEEEQEVVGDLLPHRGDHHQQHRLVALEDPVPVDAPALEHVGDDADRGREHERPQHAGDRRRHGVGPDQQRLVGHRAAQHAVGHGREQQRDRDAEERHQHAEQRGDLERVEVVAVREQGGEVREADELASSGRRRPAAGTNTRPPAPPARRRTRS